jgi:isopentenyl-diphosphate delta-isomerase
LREEVILVNERDEQLGVAEKLATHSSGVLHRAFSIFIFSSAGKLLLQRRTTTKYHSKGLWSNTCCGHPRPGETTEAASLRRLYEEMGFHCAIKEVFSFTYYSPLDNGLFEHEYDHVFVGQFDGTPNPSLDEVEDWKWIDLPALKIEMERRPEDFTYWFKLSLEAVCGHVWPRNLLGADTLIGQFQMLDYEI